MCLSNRHHNINTSGGGTEPPDDRPPRRGIDLHGEGVGRTARGHPHRKAYPAWVFCWPAGGDHHNWLLFLNNFVKIYYDLV